jgi:large subunit ribosomal protein L21
MDYAIIRVGGKQYRVREGETIVVDRVRTEEGKTFNPDILLGDGGTVTATVVAHGRGPKVRIGKYRRRTGYKRHTGFRAATSEIQISLGATKRTQAEKPAPAAEEAHAPVEAEAAEAPAVEGLPEGYESMTVAQISDGAKTWDAPELEAALAYEQAHAERKGAIAALESALRARGEDA